VSFKIPAALYLVLLATPAAAINLNITSSSGVAGGSIQFAVGIFGIEGGGAAVNNAQLDILFDTSVFYVPADPRRACQISPRLAQLAHTETLPVSPMAPAGMQRLRLSVIDTVQPLGDVTDGEFYFCSLDVREDAPAGPTQLAGVRQNVGDTTGRILPTSVGSAVVLISSAGNADAIQPRAGGGSLAPAAAPAIDIPAAQANPPERSERPPAEAAGAGRQGDVVSGRPSGSGPMDPSAESSGAPTPDVNGGSELGKNHGPDTATELGYGRTPTFAGTRASPAASEAVKTPTASRTEPPRNVGKSPTSQSATTARATVAPTETHDAGGCALSRGDASFGGLWLMAMSWVFHLVRRGGYRACPTRLGRFR